MNPLLYLGLEMAVAAATAPSVPTPVIDTTNMTDRQFDQYIQIRKDKEQAYQRLSDTMMRWSAQMNSNQPPPPTVIIERKLDPWQPYKF